MDSNSTMRTASAQVVTPARGPEHEAVGGPVAKGGDPARPGVGEEGDQAGPSHLGGEGHGAVRDLLGHRVRDPARLR